MKRKLAKETSREMKKLNADETINSGNWGDGDAIISLEIPICFKMYDGIMVESKMTEKKSFSIKKHILDKISKEARKKSCLPVLYSGLIDENKVVTGFATLKIEDFKLAIEYMQYLQNEVQNLNFELEEKDNRKFEISYMIPGSKVGYGHGSSVSLYASSYDDAIEKIRNQHGQTTQIINIKEVEND